MASVVGAPIATIQGAPAITAFCTISNETRPLSRNPFIPSGNFSSLPEISKWILSLGMILGRLELFAILVLFLPSFWVK